MLLFVLLILPFLQTQLSALCVLTSGGDWQSRKASGLPRFCSFPFHKKINRVDCRCILPTSLEGPFDRNGILSILMSIDSILFLCCSSMSSLKAEQTYKWLICWNFLKFLQIVPKSSKFLQIVPKNSDSHLLQGNCFLCLLFKPLLPHWGHLTIVCFIPHCWNAFLYFHILAFLYFCIFVVLPPISTISHWGYLTIFWDWNHVFSN